MIKLISKKQLMDQLGISSTVYYSVTKPDSPDYIPDFPKPVNLFTGKKLRFNSVEVEQFIMRHSNSANDDNTNQQKAG
ncbi:hypothetical protein [Neptunicella sp.]|uniref:hypothetical protein n=1 Tax=Neptunicella sp. TaxID=2125986 RepID=UPI003F69405B